MLLAIIAVLLFAIAMGNERSRKILLALVGWAFILAGICLTAVIAIGMLFAVIAFAISGNIFGPFLAAFYGLGALATGAYYSSQMSFSSASNTLFILCALIFWPLVLLLLLFVQIKDGNLTRR